MIKHSKSIVVQRQARRKTKKVSYAICPRCQSPVFPSPITPDWAFCAQPSCRMHPPLLMNLLQTKEFAVDDDEEG